jgi:hypothetical protein
MTTLTSTVPGAVGVLQGHFQAVADALPDLNILVYTGIPAGTKPEQNFLMIGNEAGQLLAGYHQDWAGMPASAERRSEEYGILCTIRALAGGNDPMDRMADAFTMWDAVLAELQSDPKASGSITPSGSWQVVGMDVPAWGPLGGKGTGMAITFTVEVSNVRLTS